MKKTTLTSLNWNDRFALIDHFSPSVETACSVFGVSRSELMAANNMRAAGTFRASSDLDVSSYESSFRSAVPAPAPPLTAYKRIKAPKKRGRKGTNIKTAFESIPRTATELSKFAEKYNVSQAVLRQSRRFDTCSELGQVRVKQIKLESSRSKTLMIWRE